MRQSEMMMERILVAVTAQKEWPQGSTWKDRQCLKSSNRELSRCATCLAVGALLGVEFGVDKPRTGALVAHFDPIAVEWAWSLGSFLPVLGESSGCGW